MIKKRDFKIKYFMRQIRGLQIIIVYAIANISFNVSLELRISQRCHHTVCLFGECARARSDVVVEASRFLFIDLKILIFFPMKSREEIIFE